MAKKNSTKSAATETFEDPTGPNPSQVGGGVDAASDAEAEAGAKKSGYETMVVGISKAHKPKHDALTKLSEKLGCKPSALVWLAVDQLLKSPPTIAPAGATPNTGTASGFWVRPVRDKSTGAVKSVDVVEVESRSDVTDGRTFLRYSDDKERNRAKNAAVRAAKYDMDLLGFPGEPKVRELPKAEAASK